MKYKIVRFDAKEDNFTSQTFLNYSEAYDLLNKLYGDLCCSDTEYEDRTYYDIVEEFTQDRN